MADLKNTVKRIEDWINAPFAMNAEIDPQIVHDALELLKQYSGLAKALEQSNAVNEHLNAEIAELKEREKKHEHRLTVAELHEKYNSI